jgi:hypothetical protein
MIGLVDKHVFGLDVFVDQTALVSVAERRRQSDGNAQEVSRLERLLSILFENEVEGFAAWVGENKDGPSFMTRERYRFGRPGRFKFGCKRVFVFKPSQTLGKWLLCGGSDHQKRLLIAALPCAVKRDFRGNADRFQHVLRSS